MITVEQARGMYEESDSAHGFDHVLRVWRLSERIGRQERADLRILKAATLLHDVGRAEQNRSGACHALVGARLAREALADQPEDLVDRVAAAILQHRFRGEHAPDTLEARVLYDADKLDAMGAIGVARAYAIAGVRNQRLWAHVPSAYANRPPHEGEGDLESLSHTPVHEYRFKLSKLRATLYTPTARRIAQSRHDFMIGFFQRLELEVAGGV